MKFDEILREHNVRFETEGKHCRTGWLQFNCPYCGGPLYMGYNLAGRYLNCWRCGGKNLADAISRLTGMTYGEAHRALEDLAAERIDEREVRGRYREPKGVRPLQKPHREYLRSRDFNPKEITKLWDVGGIGLAARLAWRLYIPIYQNAKPVSWTTRSIAAYADLRYVAASPEEEEVPRLDVLYGADYCRQVCIVHEGPLDVWRTGPGAVATMGAAVSTSQLSRIADYPYRVICFDNEPEAQRRARKLCDALEMFPGKTRIAILDANDPASASDKEVRALRKFLKTHLV